MTCPTCCGLISDDPAVRESPLDGKYGAMHHQGDVYECTIASIPFLLEAPLMGPR
jgi:hypothetical protein